MHITKFVGSFPMPLVVDVSWSFGNLQTNLKALTGIRKQKITFFLCIMLQPLWILLVVESVIKVLLNI